MFGDTVEPILMAPMQIVSVQVQPNQWRHTQIISCEQIFIISGSALVIKVCQGFTKALRNHLQAHHNQEFVGMVNDVMHSCTITLEQVA